MLETHTDDDRSSDWTVIFDGHRKHEYLKSLTIYHDYDSSRSHLVLDAPNLTHLVLRDTVPSLASPLRLLRVLKIDLGGGGVTLGNDGPVMNILHGTPLLSELDFNFLYRPGVAGPLLESATYSAPVTLNHLQSARITQFARLNNQSMVWPSIRVPESASLRIKMRGAAVDCYVDLVHALSRQLRYEDYHHLDLRLGRNFQIALLSAPGKLNGGPSVFFQHSAGNAIQWDTILGLLPSNMRPELVTSMNVCARMPYDSGSSATALNTFFDAYPAVVTLQLDTDAYVNRNLHRLIAENARAAGAGDKTLLFPVLDTIIISRGAHRILAGVRVNIEGHWNLVIEMLKQRAAIGKRVRRVALVGEWSAGNSAEGAVVLQRIEEHAIGLLAQLVDEVEDRRLSATLDSVV
ncbi:unnamed protein product [Peniophora sp. CBMAI 1063]|nr:unnamed protein product [Peniophora sp. CBMAI 1063]